jgi:hypothetical protein
MGYVMTPRDVGRRFLLSMAVGLTIFGALAVRDAVSIQAAGQCGMQRNGQPVAFCETFDTTGGGTRSGNLDGVLWGTSRTTGNNNVGQNILEGWVPAHLDCGGVLTLVQPPNDVKVCNGQLHEALNDNPSGAFDSGTVAALALYPKQPFDFAGRTATISFDVSNDSQGTHGAWPEIWVTSSPAPVPFAHFGQWNVPQHGFGIRFGGFYEAGNGGADCPATGQRRVGVDSLDVIRNYVADDNQISGASFTVTQFGCVVESSGPNGPLNHYEVQVSQNSIDVWGTDAGSTVLKHIIQYTNVNLTFSRGLVWLEDAHYNADKSGYLPLQHDHTFAWDNLAFDGPVIARDHTFDALDALTAAGDGTKNLAKAAFNDSPSHYSNWTTVPIDAASLSTASSAALMWNYYSIAAQPGTWTYAVNGHVHTAANLPGNATPIFPVPLSEILTGSNSVVIYGDQGTFVSNVDILLRPGGANPIPTNPPSSPTSTSTAVATVQPTPTQSPPPGGTTGVTGVLSVQGRTSAAGVLVAVAPSGQTTVTNSAGQFTFGGLTPGTRYTFSASFPGFLKVSHAVTIPNSTPLTLPPGQLIGGDVDGDGAVTIADVSAVAGDFGLVPTHGPTDLNGNGVVDIGDVSMVAANFGLSGPTPW